MRKDNQTSAINLDELSKELEQECQRSQALLVLLELLIQTNDAASMQKAAEHIGLSSKDLFKLYSKSKDSALRITVAQHINTPAAILENLANDLDEDVCIAVASNKTTSESILLHLAKNNERNEVIYAVAKNESLPSAGFRFLQKNEDYNVRLIIASNSKTPIMVAAELTKDEDEDVQERMIKHIYSWPIWKRIIIHELLFFQRMPATLKTWITKALKKER